MLTVETESEAETTETSGRAESQWHGLITNQW